MRTCITSPSVTENYYCVDKLLGRGSYGEVYRGYALAEPDIPVAVKVPKMDLTLPDFLSAYHRTVREAEFLQKTSSPYVVRYVDHCRDSSFPFLVMEYVPETLAKVQLTPQLVEDITVQLPEIVAALTDAGVIHCDLREHNIGYQNRKLKLLDFGLAIPFEHSVLYVERQARDYLPPEFRRFNWVTKTLDTYSAGRVLEHLLTGEYSSSPKKTFAKMKEIYGRDPPKSFQRLLRRMLRPDSFLRLTPPELRTLAQDALTSLKKNNPFSLDAMVPLAEAGIDFGISSSSP